MWDGTALLKDGNAGTRKGACWRERITERALYVTLKTV